MPVVTEEQIASAAQLSKEAAIAQDTPMGRMVRDVLRLTGEKVSADQAVLSVAAAHTIAFLEPLLALVGTLATRSTPLPPELRRDLEQMRERVAFLRLLPSLAQTHFGQYVAFHDGELVDADPSQRALVRRCVERFGDTSLYVVFVGPVPEVRVPTPFFRHPA